MIEKMQFLSITGPKNDIDRVVEQYLSRYEFQPESTMSELSATAELKPFVEINPYREEMSKVKELMNLADTKGAVPDRSISLEQAIDTVEKLDDELSKLREKNEELTGQLETLEASMEKIRPFGSLNMNVHELLGFKSVKYRFGRISIDYIEKFEKYSYHNMYTVFCECERNREYVWGVYFCPKNSAEEVDAVYKSLHFERFRLPDEYEGTPAEAIRGLQGKIDVLKAEIAENNRCIEEKLSASKNQLVSADEKLSSYSKSFDIRKLAACVENKKTFYIMCLWMAKTDVQKLLKEIENDPDVHCVVYDDNDNRVSTPPVKLKNPRLFKPYEMYVRMYGLPNYKEMDPTVFVALTYSFIFGWMFGDVGQGLVLVIGGFLLYHFRKINLAAIISMAGVFSTFFGFMFGSIFGFEDIIEPVWMRPMSNMSSLPMIGRLNTVFIIAIAFGMGLILLTMIFHIINAVRAKDFEGIWFDTNGVAGLVFYGSLVGAVVLIMTGHSLPGGILMAVLFIIPLICIGFKEQLAAFCQKKKPHEATGPVMVVVQALFELIEVLLSYFSNTISFVRIGAFAVSHAAMMEVVLMLAGAESGSPNIFVIILGNLFVCGMEGLIVGIQVLRLEYYEMFSRFYKGDGREFKPFYTKEK